MARPWRSLGAALFLFVASGCAQAPEEGPASAFGDAGEAPMLHGVVIDVELIPVADALVSIQGDERQAVTDAEGRFALGPLVAGAYTLVAEKLGYAAATATVAFGEGSPPAVTLQLIPVASDVPYFETQLHVTTIGCAVATPTSRLTCGLINQVSGTNAAPDSSVFRFEIPNEGLAMLLGETAWVPGTAFARQLSVNVLDVEGDQTNCLTTKCYSEAVGASPIRYVHLPDQQWGPDPYQPFPAEQGHAFNVYLMPPFGSAENPAMLFLEQRADNYLTFFYNRPGSDSFTALPDA